MVPVILAAIAAAQAIDQAQRAKNQQQAEIAKTQFGPWTSMQGGVVPQPAPALLEAAGGYMKGMEYDQAKEDADMQKAYLNKRIAWGDMQAMNDEFRGTDAAVGVRPTRRRV